MFVRLSTLSLLAMFAACGPAMAEATSLGVFSKWAAWEDTDASGKICYISSQPETTEPSNVRRSPIHFLVTHRQGASIRNEVATIVGYPTDDNASASASVDGTSFPFVTDASTEAGWLASDSDESGFVSAMKAGSRMVVRARSQRGTNTVDTYSLAGVTAAMEAIDTACPGS